MTAPRTRSPEQFVHDFAALWAAPTPDGFLELLDDDCSVYWPGMPQALQGKDIPAHVSRVQGLMPDIRLEVQRWSATGDLLFIEWIMLGTVAGQPIRVAGVDRFVLREGKGIEMRAFFDQQDLLSQVGLASGVSLLDTMSA